MTDWVWAFQPSAEKDIAGLDREVRQRVIDKLDWLVENFENYSPVLLAGEFKDFFKLRVGDWRIFYRIDWKGRGIIICHIERRDKAYKGL